MRPELSTPLLLLVALLGCEPMPAAKPDGGRATSAQVMSEAGPLPDLGAPDATLALPDAPDGACVPGAPLPEAFLAGGVVDGQTAIIPGGRRISPSGVVVHVGRAPIGLALSPDGRFAYVTCDGHPEQALLVVNLETAAVQQIVPGPSAFKGVAVSPDGRTLLLAAGASGTLRRYRVGEDGNLGDDGRLSLEGYLADVAFSPDGAVAYVMSNTVSLIFEVDLASFAVTRTFETGNMPYDLVVTDSALLVSNWAEDTVQALSRATGETIAVVPVPSGPEGMALSAEGDRLYVACADEDAVAVLDPVSLARLDTFDLSHHPEGLLAASPNDVSLTVGGDTLLVAQADLNQVDLVHPGSGEVEGAVPTGWYPVAVAAHPDGQRLVIASHKGLGATPNQLNPTGLLQIAPLPLSRAALRQSTAEVVANNTRPTRFYEKNCPHVLEAREGVWPIEHVVLIVRENKTYDMVLGDLEGANGDPALAIFGEDITPNLHALARTFANLDNFHSNPEESLQGHMWVTQADCNDFVEKLRHTQLPLAGYEPASLPGSPTIFEHCLNHGVSFRNYGEVTSFSPELLGRMRDFIDPKFPFFNMGVRDELKAREVIREWSLGIFPQFVFISLPNDHTFGHKPGAPTPESMVADNDSATGMLVDWLSKSPYWERTVVFIIEDDPQSWGGDHVDAHRSLCVVASPWVKPGHVSSVHYDIASVYKTIELLLGLPPMNKNDALAAPMYDLFRAPAEGPAPVTFDARPLAVPHALNPEDAPMARESLALDWDGVDGAEGLGKILWHARKGRDVNPPPYAKGIDR